MNPLLRLALEAGPLGIFFYCNAKFGIFTATGVFMAATVVALAANWLLERRLPVMPLVSGFFVMVFGGLTLLLQDELFIKMKPTIVNTLFAVILFGGLAFGRSLLKPLFGAAFQLTDAGWRVLTFRWAGFFVFLAVVNEVVWRNFDTDTWVDFKVFAIMPITIVFTLSQMPLILRHQLPEDRPAA
ncbi:septation protein A [Zavarzinia compransoris]|uniref:Inner membrane-spanning protein YciB n=2 Tax=Zavarzinia compransoris TaxID=1264899 RepID=A0A317E4M7_9PROT|nr:septation protein A [Zavarzinia compransoris]PWR22078.1 septation protein A [Zavarzinia compransoris]